MIFLLDEVELSLVSITNWRMVFKTGLVFSAGQLSFAALSKVHWKKKTEQSKSQNCVRIIGVWGFFFRPATFIQGIACFHLFV